jgi:hypothetical protein
MGVIWITVVTYTHKQFHGTIDKFNKAQI